jgi:hypothetical protein
VLEKLPAFSAFSCISWACAFCAKDDASIFFSGPVEAEDGKYVAAPAGWLFWKLMAHSLHGEKNYIAIALAMNLSAHRRSRRG